MQIDVHKVMTTLFNVELNHTIAKYSVQKSFERVKTGGVMDLIPRRSLFHFYITRLEVFREHVYERSNDYFMSEEEFRREMDILLELYAEMKLLAERHILTPEDERELEEYFLKPITHFIESLDKDLGSSYFMSRVGELMSDAESRLQYYLLELRKRRESNQKPYGHYEIKISEKQEGIFEAEVSEKHGFPGRIKRALRRLLRLS